MKKTPLGVALVVAFCITWWIVAGNAWEITQLCQNEVQAYDAYEAMRTTEAEAAFVRAKQRRREAYPVGNNDPHELLEPVFKDFRLMASWGIGAGLLADVLLLIGALAWSKLTAKA